MANMVMPLLFMGSLMLPESSSSTDVEPRAILPVDLTAQQVEQVQHFLADHGAEAFDLAMLSGSLYKDLRAVSEFSLHTAITAQEAGLDCSLLVQLHPKAARKGERVEMRIVLGSSTQLVLDFPKQREPE